MSASSVVNQGATDLGLVKHIGELEELLGFVGVKTGETLLKFGFGFFDIGSRLRSENLAALHTEPRITVVLSPARVTFNGGNWLRFLVGHVLTVQSSEFPLGVLTEHRDIAGGRLAPSDPPVAILDVGLVQVPTGEERGAGFAKIGQSDRLGDLGTVGRLFEYLPDHPVGDTFGFRYFAPQRGVGVVVCRMCVEPSTNERNRWNQQHGTTSLLALDGDLQAVIVVLNVVGGEALKLSSPEPGIKLQGDHCGVAGIVCCLDHRFDLLLPPEHIPGVRGRIVVRGGTRRDPRRPLRVSIGISFDPVSALGETFAEHSKGTPVITISLLVLVSVVNPSNDLLGRVLLFNGRCEDSAIEALGDDCAVPEKFFTSVCGVLLREEGQTTVEREEALSVGFANLPAVFAAVLDTSPEILDSALSAHTTYLRLTQHSFWDLNPKFKSHPWLT